MQSSAIYESILVKGMLLLLLTCFSIYIAMTDVNVACLVAEIISCAYVGLFPCRGHARSKYKAMQIRKNRTINQSINQSESLIRSINHGVTLTISHDLTTYIYLRQDDVDHATPVQLMAEEHHNPRKSAFTYRSGNNSIAV